MVVLPLSSAFLFFLQRGKPMSWSGNIDLSLSSTIAAIDTESYFASAHAEQRANGAGLTLSGLYAFERQKDSGFSRVTQDRYRAIGTYDFPRRRRIFPTFSQRIEHDGVNDLALRSFTSFGVGIQLQESSDVAEKGKITRVGGVDWQVNFGISNLYERYSDNTDETNKPGVNFGSRYRARVSRGITISHDLLFTPAFRDFSDYLLSSDLKISLRLAGAYALGLDFLYDFDRSPAAGSPSLTRKYVLTIGYEF